MNAYELLSRDNYLTINKIVAKKIGIAATALLSELCYRRQYLERSGKLTEDGFFYATVESIQEELPLSEYEQRKILTSLEELEVVTVEKRGIPAKRFICINEDALIELLTESTQNNLEQVPKNFKDKTRKDLGQINNNITNNDTITVSNDTVIEEQAQASAPSPKKSTNVSGKLFSSETSKTRKTSIAKLNAFITNCQREAIKKQFAQEVLNVLDKYFIMLAETNTLHSMTTIEAQLAGLKKLPKRKQIEAVTNTITRGWKSLQYAVDDASKCGNRKCADTADPDAFTPKTMEEKTRDLFEGVSPENIF